MEAHVTETVAMSMAMPMDGVTETKAEELPKEGMHDGDGGDAKGGHGRGADTAKGRHVRCGRRRRGRQWKVWRGRWRCRWEACATETKAETPMEAKARPMYGGVTETRADGDGNNCCSDAGG